MRATRSAALLLSVSVVGACAHAEGERKEPPAETSEVALLRERVRRLEKRTSDLDAQVALLTERLASTQGSVALGRPPPPPRRRVDDPPRHVYADGAPRSIELGPPDSVSSGSVSAVPSVSSGDALASGSVVELAPVREPAREVYEPVAEPIADVVDEAPVPAAPGPPESVKGAYDWAHARMREGRYLEAIAAFEDILERHADHDLADNALYWTAVCHERRGEPRLAIEVYQKLPMLFPKSPKMPDALFGMAAAHEALGEPVLAETLYAQLVQQYPRAEKAPDARRALRRLGGG